MPSFVMRYQYFYLIKSVLQGWFIYLQLSESCKDKHVPLEHRLPKETFYLSSSEVKKQSFQEPNLRYVPHGVTIMTELSVNLCCCLQFLAFPKVAPTTRHSAQEKTFHIFSMFTFVAKLFHHSTKVSSKVLV